MEKKKSAVLLIVSYIGAFLGCFCLVMLNKNVLMTIPLGWRLIYLPTTYWLIAIVPLVIMRISKTSFTALGFSKEQIGMQIIIGITSGLALASAYFLVPYFAGFGKIVDNGMRYTELWQLAFEFVYLIIGVGAVEEIVFRGVIYRQLKAIFSNEWLAMIVSSVLFGFFHIFNGNPIQVGITTIIGFIFCLVRYKSKRCSMLSLILLHGTYDFMITLYSSLLFR